jgi:hypothetical protein
MAGGTTVSPYLECDGIGSWILDAQSLRNLMIERAYKELVVRKIYVKLTQNWLFMAQGREA